MLRTTSRFPAAFIALFCLIGAGTVRAQTTTAQRVLTAGEAGKIVPIKNLKVTPSEVSGQIVNNTPYVIRDIEVLIEYHWLWANEFKPGPKSPGHAVIVKLDKGLAPGESTTFRYVPDPPLPNRRDGRFDAEVVVAGFTTVVPPTTASSR